MIIWMQILLDHLKDSDIYEKFVWFHYIQVGSQMHIETKKKGDYYCICCRTYYSSSSLSARTIVNKQYLGTAAAAPYSRNGS